MMAFSTFREKTSRADLAALTCAQSGSSEQQHKNTLHKVK